jgi:spermidine/putrescine-binding protein
MFSKFVNRREFLDYGKLSLLFFLNSCSNLPNKVKIALQSSFYPESFKDTIPKDWKQEKINFENIRLQKNKNSILNSDFTLINDGWISGIDFSEFEKINEYALFENLDKRSIDFLGSFNQNQRSKLFPIGVVPYTIIIKNNRELINSARTSWDFLLSKKLTGKIIFPQSPRIIFSIARKINSPNSLKKLKSQAMLFDDKNMLNWLINSEACIAIVPYSLCSKYLRIDPRLSLVFPDQGVPLMWHFLLSRSQLNNEILIKWIKSLENKSIVDKLVSQGWYLPFNSDYLQSKYTSKMFPISGPSEKCWENSWSFPVLTNAQKINLKNFWNESLTP